MNNRLNTMKRLAMLVVAMAPWIISDLRMKRVFEEARRREE